MEISYIMLKRQHELSNYFPQKCKSNSILNQILVIKEKEQRRNSPWGIWFIATVARSWLCAITHWHNLKQAKLLYSERPAITAKLF